MIFDELFPHDPPDFEVAIIGAGYAGLACAVELARRSVPVTVFERSRTLGGRARVVRQGEHSIDNGQHLVLGAYSELARLMRLTGVSPRVFERLPLTLHFPGQLYLRAARLPAPFNLAVGLLRAKGLTLRERLAMTRLMRYLKRQRFQLPAEMTVSELLANTRQNERMTQLVWEPLCIAALNTSPLFASARVFSHVLRDALAASNDASEMLIPRIDLTELFPVPAARYLATRSGVIFTSTAIDAITPENGGFRLQGDPGQSLFPHLVVATAPHHAAPLVASTGACSALSEWIAGLDEIPITTVYLAFGAGVPLPEPMIGASGAPAQWLFDRGRTGGPEGLIAAVISAHQDAGEQSRAVLINAVSAQIGAILQRPLPQPEWVQVITDRRATFACRPSITYPGIKTDLPGLWLAGDYVEGEYPATLESAVRAGVKCARAIILNSAADRSITHINH